MTSYRLDPPHLAWDNNGAPHSTQFEDVYFDRESGLEETRYVFLENNQLATRFTQLEEKHNSAFTIAETGFGTGLNFLCAWQLWLQTMPKTNSQRLHFISVEKFPLPKDDLAKALAIWPSLKPLADELIQSYPVICKGLHRIELNQGQIQLSLWFGDANEGFEHINADVDAWFLDGFAPSKNPDMWNSNLFNEIKRLSHKGTSISTFTSAGIVRRGLQSIGFDIKKIKGFGKKREMLVGKLIDQTLSFSQRTSDGLAWFNNRIDEAINLNESNILVVGAGLAGCHTANALAKKGIKVSLWDQHDGIAHEASGNPQGILYPKLAASDSRLNRFYLTSYLYANRQLNLLAQGDEKIWQQTGLQQAHTSSAEQARFTKLLKEELYPETIVTHGNKDNLYLPLSGWINPAAWCEKLVRHPNIKFRGKSKLIKLEKIDANDDGLNWQATTENNDYMESFSHVILCTANHEQILNQFIVLPIKAIRGQVSSITLESEITLNQVLCQSGYVSPPLENRLNFGSTYGIKNNNTLVTQEDNKENLLKLAELLPEQDWQNYEDKCQGRVSFRCTVTDYAPIIGPIPNIEAYTKSFAFLKKNAKKTCSTISQNHPNLYINIGHGSRGLISTPLAGEYLAALISNETSVYERQIEHLLHPARFLIKGLKKGLQ